MIKHIDKDKSGEIDFEGKFLKLERIVVYSDAAICSLNLFHKELSLANILYMV